MNNLKIISLDSQINRLDAEYKKLMKANQAAQNLQRSANSAKGWLANKKSAAKDAKREKEQREEERSKREAAERKAEADYQDAKRQLKADKRKHSVVSLLFSLALLAAITVVVVYTLVYTIGSPPRVRESFRGSYRTTDAFNAAFAFSLIGVIATIAHCSAAFHFYFWSFNEYESKGRRSGGHTAHTIIATSIWLVVMIAIIIPVSVFWI